MIENTILEAIQVVVGNLVMSLLTILFPILVTYVIGWFKSQYDLIRSHVKVEHLALLDYFVEVAVKSAEQVGLVDMIENTGEAKKQYAIDYLQSALRARGLNYLADNVDELSAAIESAINDGIQNKAS